MFHDISLAQLTMILSLPAHITTRTIPSKGTGLYTSKQIEAGKLVFKDERPLITVLDSARLRGCCEWCLTAGHEGGDLDDGYGGVRLRACTGCRVVRYCSKVGQGIFLLFSFCYGGTISLQWEVHFSIKLASIALILFFVRVRKSRDRQISTPVSVSFCKLSTRERIERHVVHYKAPINHDGLERRISVAS